MLRLEIELKARGLTQAKLARKADVNESSMSRIVRGVEPAYYEPFYLKEFIAAPSHVKGLKS